MSTERKKWGTRLGFAALALAVVTTVLWFRQANLVDIPENRTLFVVCWVTAALLGVAALAARPRWFGGVAAAPAILIGAFLPFTVGISLQQVAPNAIQVGQTIPHFTGLDDRGQGFDSASLQGKTVLMKFFRGHW